MPPDPKRLLRGVGKLIAVVLAAGLAGAGIGIGLAKLTGGDDTSAPVLPATASTAAKTTQTAPRATTSKTPTGTTTAPAVYRVPRVEVLSAQLGPIDAATGRAQATVRVRVTNRGIGPLRISTPQLLSAQDKVPLDAAARGGAGALLRRIAVGRRATGSLRFTLPAAVAQRLTATPQARLRIARRTVALPLETSTAEAPAG